MNARSAPDLPWQPSHRKSTTGHYRDPGAANAIAASIAWNLGDGWRYTVAYRRTMLASPHSRLVGGHLGLVLPGQILPSVAEANVSFCGQISPG